GPRRLACVMVARPPRLRPFPYTTLFRSERGHHRPVVGAQARPRDAQPDPRGVAALLGHRPQPGVGRHAAADEQVVDPVLLAGQQDRKRTRLNSSHVKTSYAVFRLKTTSR